jgi:hypothetical protein
MEVPKKRFGHGLRFFQGFLNVMKIISNSILMSCGVQRNICTFEVK